MRVTPEEIRQQQFSSKFRGFSMEEVDNFLDIVAGDFEQVVSENSEMIKDLERFRGELKELKKNELNFRTMIGAAQEFKEDVTSRANREAELILRQAELKAKELVGGAEARIADLEQRIGELRMKKRQFEASFRALVENYMSMLDSIEDRGENPK